MEQKIGSRDETEMNMEASEIEREMVKARSMTFLGSPLNIGEGCGVNMVVSISYQRTIAFSTFGQPLMKLPRLKP